MLRAWATAAVNVLVVGTVGVAVLLVGLVYPSRVVFARAAALWAKCVLLAAGVRLTVIGLERFPDRSPRLLVGNHQSALDIPILLLAWGGDLRFMAKDTLFRIPFFGWTLSRYGFAPIDRSHARRTAATLDRMLERLRQKPVSFAVFPEGTRSRDGRLLPFRRGTMKIASRTGLPVVPFTIDGSIEVVQKDRFAVHPGPVTITFHPEIAAEEVSKASPDELCNRLVATIGGALIATHAPHPGRDVKVAVEG